MRNLFLLLAMIPVVASSNRERDAGAVEKTTIQNLITGMESALEQPEPQTVHGRILEI